jgi:chitinase
LPRRAVYLYVTRQIFLPRRLRWFLACALAGVVLFLLQPSAISLRLRGWRRAAHPVLVGYFPQWGLYNERPYYVKELVANGGADRLDQINYAQGFVSDRRCSIADPKADLNTTYTRENSVNGKPDNPASPFRGYFHQMQELKRRNPRLKILISLEGKEQSFAEDARPENRQAFVASCVDLFLRGKFAPGIHEPGLFDGLDIDWESPHEEDAANFQALLVEFRRQMNAVRPGLRLSIAVGDSPRMLAGTDFAAIAPLVDQVGIMNYDYTGPWDAATGFLAPLFSSSTDPRHSNSIERSIESYKAAGVPAAKLLMGVPFYGYSWTSVDKTDNGLFQPGHGVRGDRPYRYLRTLSAPFSLYRDAHSQAPWLYDGETFWTYEDPISVRYKVSYAAREGIGGVMIWELSNDTEDAELLNVAYRSLHHPIHSKVFRDATETEQRRAVQVAAQDSRAASGPVTAPVQANGPDKP